MKFININLRLAVRIRKENLWVMVNHSIGCHLIRFQNERKKDIIGIWRLGNNDLSVSRCPQMEGWNIKLKSSKNSICNEDKRHTIQAHPYIPERSDKLLASLGASEYRIHGEKKTKKQQDSYPVMSYRCWHGSILSAASECWGIYLPTEWTAVRDSLQKWKELQLSTHRTPQNWSEAYFTKGSTPHRQCQDEGKLQPDCPHRSSCFCGLELYISTSTDPKNN